MALEFNPYEAPQRRDPSSQLAMHLPANFLRGSQDFIRGLIQRAEGAEAKGAKPSDIFHDTARQVQDPANETGLYRDPANNWLFELSDQNARIKEHSVSDLWPRMAPDSGGSTSREPLSDFYNHPELFDRIPMLGGIPTKITQPGVGQDPVGTAGYYRSGSTAEGQVWPGGRMDVYGQGGLNDPNSGTPNSILDLVTHETQHGVQDFTGLPRGGNSRDADLMNIGKLGVQVPAQQALGARLRKTAIDFAQEYAARNGVTPQEGMKFWMANNPNAATVLGTAVMAGGQKGSFTPFAKARAPAFTNMLTYLSLAGETQARQAALRKFMTVPERLQVPPFLPDLLNNILPQPNQLIRTDQRDFANPDPSVLERLLREGP